jgi:hypothetical protein
MTVRVYVITTAPPLFLGDLRYGLSGAQVARYGPAAAWTSWRYHVLTDKSMCLASDYLLSCPRPDRPTTTSRRSAVRLWTNL